MSRGDGKPAARIVERIERSVDLDALTDHFVGQKRKMYYLALVAETPCCWPRVLKGEMTNDRFHERIERMGSAILRATGVTSGEVMR